MGNVIQTRYRDIPWEEARKCYRLDSGGYPVDRYSYEDQVKNWDARFRGKPVEIIVPSDAGPQYKHVRCGGPFFRLAKGRPAIVCPHIAEIGD